MPRFRILGFPFFAVALILLAVLLLLHCRLAKSQTENQRPSESQKQGLFGFKVPSNLVVVRVVVRDAQGQPVKGLRKEDFKVLDQGKVQTVTQFEVEASSTRSVNPPAAATTAAAVAPTPPAQLHFLALYFDDLNTSDADLTRAREAADQYLGANLSPADRVGIFTSGGTLSDFTSDPGQFHQALARLHASPTASRAPGCPELSDYQALQITRGDGDAMAVALDEKKRVCDMGGSMDPDPGRYVMMLARTVVAQDEMRSQRSLQELDQIVKYVAHMPGQRTIILVSPGFLSANEHFQLDRIIDSALRAQVVISSLDAKGLALMMREMDVSQATLPSEALLATADSMDTAREFFATDVLAELAEGTGGEYLHNDNDLKTGLSVLAGSPVQYLLAFAPGELKEDGKFHELKVLLTEPHKGFTVQARRGYFAATKGTSDAQIQPQAISTMDPAAKERIREAMFSKVDTTQLPVELDTEIVKATDSSQLTVLARLDTQSLQLHKEGGRNQNTVIFVSAVFDASGNLVTGQQWQAKVDVTDDALPKLRNDGINVKMSFQLKSGAYTIREIVTDSEQHQITDFSRSVIIP
jgi:VWFA-related protein